MERQDRKRKKVNMLFRKKPVQDNDEVPAIYPIWNYGKLRKKQNHISMPIILSFQSKGVVYDEGLSHGQDNLLRVQNLNPNYEHSSADELAERCAQLPPRVGEDEYLARLDEIEGDNLGEAS
jgi:hypothetical protein